MSLSIKQPVVIDSNVFVSAIIGGGNPNKVLNLWLAEKFTLVISPEILAEILTVLIKLQTPPSVVNRFKELIETHAQKVIPKSTFKICRDPKDNKFLELSFDGKADFLVTGDSDLLVLKKFKKTIIVKPKDFLIRLRSG